MLFHSRRDYGDDYGGRPPPRDNFGGGRGGRSVNFNGLDRGSGNWTEVRTPSDGTKVPLP